MSDFRIERESVSFWLKVKPRGSRDRLKRDAQGELILEVHAPPVEGEANEACVRFLARVLGIPRGSVGLVVGEKSRRKLIRISGRSGEETAAQIKALAQGSAQRRRD